MHPVYDTICLHFPGHKKHDYICFRKSTNPEQNYCALKQTWENLNIFNNQQLLSYHITLPELKQTKNFKKVVVVLIKGAYEI